MKFRLVILFSFLLLSACGGGGGSSSSGSESADLNKNNVILVLGDSIGIGTGSSTAFPNVIQAQTGISVINNSRGSASAQDQIFQVNSLIAQHNPRFIVALLGTNNANSNIPFAVSALQLLADSCQRNAIICIIGTLPPLRDSAANARAEDISNGIRNIANVRIAGIRAAFSPPAALVDDLHPNAEGQQLIGRLFVEQIF